jgi:hypothetical protein
MIPPSRVRPAPGAIRSHVSAPTDNPAAVELLRLVNTLSDILLDKTQKEHGLEYLRLQSECLHRIRQHLIEDPVGGDAREAFRRVHGFKTLFSSLRSLADFFPRAHLSKDHVTAFFELVKALLDVLSDALHDNSPNRRYFTLRVEHGGWNALKHAFEDTGIQNLLGSDQDDDKDVAEQFLGHLLAFVLGDESVVGTFRGLRQLSTPIPPSSPDVLANAAEASLEHVLRRHVMAKFTGTEMLQNPEMLPVLIHFWHSTLKRPPATHISALSFAVPITLQHIQAMSIRNAVSLHESQILRPLLSVYVKSDTPPELKRLLRFLLQELLLYGVNNLEESYVLFSNATTSNEASDLLLHAMKNSPAPQFVQFDLSLHGHSSLEIPSLGRSFPPFSTAGYTIMTWVRFDEFDPLAHTTIFGASDSTETCFVLAFLEKDDRQLVLQTSVKSQTRSSVRFRGAVFRELQWYHIAIVHRRPRTTAASKASLFVNGVFIETLKCQYPSSPPVRSTSAESFASITGSSSNQSSPVPAFLGTPQAIAPRKGRDMVRTKWSMASFHLFQEAIGDDMIQVYHKLGPRYTGNFQDCLGSFQTYRASAEIHLQNELQHQAHAEKSELMSALRQSANKLVPESMLLLSFTANGVLDNSDQNHVDETRLIKFLSRDASTALRNALRSRGNFLAVNSAVPSYNEALTLPHGLAFLKGDPVVSVPQALDDSCWRLGGSAPVLLKLLDLARTKDEVLSAVRVIFQALEGSWRNSEAMERENGYGVLAGLMREKLGFGSIFGDSNQSRPPPIPVDLGQREELALELLRLTLSFVGYNEVNPEDALLINGLAYRFLLVDFDTWRRAPIATQKLYYSQFVHYAAKGKHHRFNSKRLVRMRKSIAKTFIMSPS